LYSSKHEYAAPREVIKKSIGCKAYSSILATPSLRLPATDAETVRPYAHASGRRCDQIYSTIPSTYSSSSTWPSGHPEPSINNGGEVTELASGEAREVGIPRSVEHKQ
jgi:hypothetical protein